MPNKYLDLSLGNDTIHTIDNLFSLNDLHRASGGATKHQPALFVRLNQTQVLISEIERSTDMQIAIKAIRGGVSRRQGTYACRELVIAYAAWISAEFHLKVIRVFLDQHDKARRSPSDLTDEQQKIVDALLNQLAAAAAQTREYDRIFCLLRGIAGSVQLAADNLHDLCKTKTDQANQHPRRLI